MGISQCKANNVRNRLKEGWCFSFTERKWANLFLWCASPFPKHKKVTLPCDDWYKGKVLAPRCFKNWRDAKPGILGQEERGYAWRRCWTPGNIVLSQHLKVGARECRFWEKRNFHHEILTITSYFSSWTVFKAKAVRVSISWQNWICKGYIMISLILSQRETSIIT